MVRLYSFSYSAVMPKCMNQTFFSAAARSRRDSASGTNRSLDCFLAALNFVFPQLLKRVRLRHELVWVIASSVNLIVLLGSIFRFEPKVGVSDLLLNVLLTDRTERRGIRSRVSEGTNVRSIGNYKQLYLFGPVLPSSLLKNILLHV